MQKFNQIGIAELSKSANFFELFAIVMIPIAFVISDWKISLFSFGELVLIPVTLGLLIFTFNRIERKEVYWFLGFCALLFWNLSANLLMNTEFDLKAAIAGTIKLVFFSIFLITSWKYFSTVQSKKRLLISLNGFSIIVIIIGIYIVYALYSDTQIPYEFFWRFARTDYQSYYFRGPEGLVRMRSIFDEPAHLGYFLNTILGLNLFGKIRSSKLWIANLILVMGLIMTFSYSAVGIMIIQFILYAVTRLKGSKEWVKDHRVYLGLISLIIIILFFREIFYETIVSRTLEIFSGEDNSFVERIAGSWQYVKTDNILFGNGIGNTGNIFNNYAYFLSDLGLPGLLLFIGITAQLLYFSPTLGTVYILLNFQRGGYLGPAFWLLVALFYIYSKPYESDTGIRKRKTERAFSHND